MKLNICCSPKKDTKNVFNYNMSRISAKSASLSNKLRRMFPEPQYKYLMYSDVTSNCDVNARHVFR